MKKQKILISLLSIICLVGCASNKPASSNDGGNLGASVSPTGFDNQFAITDFGTAKFEAEKFDYTNWFPFDGDEVVEESKASGGAYLAAAEEGSTAVFYFSVQAYSRVVFSAAYAQREEDLGQAIDLENTFAYHIENISDLHLGATKTLKARSSATNWELISYAEESLYEGEYKVTLEVLAGAEYVPSIDYIQFKTSDATVVPVDPSTITEVPDNDMRNLQQYKFLNEEDLLKYKTYATGANLSAPEGIKLRFEELESASKYYVQVALSEAELDAAPIREATEKVYKFQNALLGTKYYFRAATSEAGLASAQVKNITTTDVAPRVVYVPDVLNFRDIGGWASDLVPNGKIKQGMYFRCAQLDGAAGSTTSKLDSAGKGKAALKELGIKCDIDMRDIGNQPSRGAGPSPANSADWPFTFVSAAVPSGSEPVRWEGGTYQGTNIADQYKKIFDALANCDNEPALLHCTYGADRTGIVSFFLEALLGMSEYDMTRDYLWTQFTQGRNVKILESEGAEFPQWISKTNNCEGSTFADKMENHLMEFGIAKSTLEHIREIFVPGYVAKA
jgi:hypothetical protein